MTDSPETPKRRVLVCDDEPLVAELIGKYFEVLGCDVVTETDPVQATRLAIDEAFYLTTIDLMMGGQEGKLIIESLSLARPGARILVITGLEADHPAVQEVRGHVTAVLHKPFQMKDLAEALRQASM